MATKIFKSPQAVKLPVNTDEALGSMYGMVKIASVKTKQGEAQVFLHRNHQRWGHPVCYRIQYPGGLTGQIPPNAAAEHSLEEMHKASVTLAESIMAGLA